MGGGGSITHCAVRLMDDYRTDQDPKLSQPHGQDDLVPPGWSGGGGRILYGRPRPYDLGNTAPHWCRRAISSQVRKRFVKWLMAPLPGLQPFYEIAAVEKGRNCAESSQVFRRRIKSNRLGNTLFWCQPEHSFVD